MIGAEGTSLSDLAILISAIATAMAIVITSITTAVISLRTQARTETKVDKVHGELVTMNGGTVGSLANAAETRRILAKPVEERTALEVIHLAQSRALEEPL